MMVQRVKVGYAYSKKFEVKVDVEQKAVLLLLLPDPFRGKGHSGRPGNSPGPGPENVKTESC